MVAQMANRKAAFAKLWLNLLNCKECFFFSCENIVGSTVLAEVCAIRGDAPVWSVFVFSHLLLPFNTLARLWVIDLNPAAGSSVSKCKNVNVAVRRCFWEFNVFSRFVSFYSNMQTVSLYHIFLSNFHFQL